jgi:hypothetical protein
MRPSLPVRQRQRRARDSGAFLPRLARQHDVPDTAIQRRTFIAPRAKPPSATANCGAWSNSSMCRSSAGAQRARSACPLSHTS